MTTPITTTNRTLSEAGSSAVDTSLAAFANFVAVATGRSGAIVYRLEGTIDGTNWVPVSSGADPSASVDRLNIRWSGLRGEWLGLRFVWVSGTATSIAVAARCG